MHRFSSKDEPSFLSAFLPATAALILSLYVFPYFFLSLLCLSFHPQISFPSATPQLWLQLALSSLALAGSPSKQQPLWPRGLFSGAWFQRSCFSVKI